MSRPEIIKKIKEKNKNLNSKSIEIIIDTFSLSIQKALFNKRSVEIRGFGSFVVKEYKSYQGRNPKTGEKIEVPPKKLPFFKVGKELKERIDVDPAEAGGTPGAGGAN